MAFFFAQQLSPDQHPDQIEKRLTHEFYQYSLHLVFHFQQVQHKIVDLHCHLKLADAVFISSVSLTTVKKPLSSP